MIDSFLKYIQYEKRYSRHTITSYKTDLDQFANYFNDVYELSDLRKADYYIIRSWIVFLVESGMVARSVNRKIASLRAFYKFLQKNNHISSNPVAKIIAPKIKKKLPTFIEQQNLAALLDDFEFSDDLAGIRDKLILELLYGTGIRLAELIETKHEDINYFERSIKVLGKGSKERIIPLNTSLLNTIKIYCDKKQVCFIDLCNGRACPSTTHLIITDKGEKCYPKFIYRLVKKHLNLITTAEKKSPHVLRHSFATHLLNKGADLNAIKELLGHSSLAATQVYTHNSIEKLKTIFDKAHPKA